MTAKPKNRTAKTPRNSRAAKSAAAKRTSQTAKISKLDRMVTLLSRPKGARLAELVKETGWQPHSVRGALAGALKRKGHAISSEKTDGGRRYRIESGNDRRR